MGESRYTVSDVWTIELVERLFNGIRDSSEGRDRFEWRYLRNPDGRTRVWILHTVGGDAVGLAACYPREMWVAGRPCRALVCGDFSVAAAHRTLGPAVSLRREAKRLVDSGEFDFLYSHPVPAALAVHQRAGHRQIGEMVRWALPLRADHILSQRLNPRAAMLLAPAANSVLAGRRLMHRMASWSRSRGLQIRRVTEFSDEYDVLDTALAQSYPVIGCRTRAYLTWRFLANPRINAVVLEARDLSDKLAGYLVLEDGEPMVRIHDLAYLPGCGAELALLTEASRYASTGKARTLSIVVQQGFPGAAALRLLGFSARDESAPSVCYGGSDFFGTALVENAANWFMTEGDRDI